MVNLDILLYFLFLIPLAFATYHHEILKDRSVFLKYLAISLFILILGIAINYGSKPKNMNYFGSQILFIFLILQMMLRKVYFKIFKRDPEFSRYPTNRLDFIYYLLIFTGMITIPFLVDSFIIQKIATK